MSAPSAGTGTAPERNKYRMLHRVNLGGTYLILIVGAILTLTPFLWMLLTSFKPEAEVFVFPPQLLPSVPSLEAYRTLLERSSFGRNFLNSAFITLTITLANLFTASLGGYAFAKIRFFGRDKIFALLLVTMMIPGQVTMIPSFIVLKTLGLLNNYFGLIIPATVSVFGLFLVKQFMEGIPDDLIDAARIDGCSELQVYWHIVLPALKPVMATIAIFTFMGSWNDFLWPLIVMTDEKFYTLPVALSMLNGEHTTEWALLMAGAVIVTAPVLIVFFSLQKYFVEGIVHTGIKG